MINVEIDRSVTYRPHVVVAERSEKRLRRDAFTVVHVAFGGIVTKNSIDDDSDFAISEPSIRTEPCFGRYCRGRHKENCRHSDGESDEPFDQEKPTSQSVSMDELSGSEWRELPSPASQTMHTSHVQKAKCQDRSDDLGTVQSSPEEGKTNRQFLACVEVRQPDIEIVNTSSLNAMLRRLNASLVLTIVQDQG